MPILYSLASRKNPQDKDAAPRFYAKVQSSGTVDFDTLAEDIAYATTLTDGDVSNVLRALVKQIKKHLADGKIVQLDGLGSFQFQINGEGAAVPKDYTPSAYIKRMRIQFRPGKLVKEVLNLSTLSFKRVMTKKLQAEQAEDFDNGTTDDNGGNSGSADFE